MSHLKDMKMMMFQLSRFYYNKEPPKIVLVIILAPIVGFDSNRSLWAGVHNKTKANTYTGPTTPIQPVNQEPCCKHRLTEKS